MALMNCAECGKLFAQNRATDSLCLDCTVQEEKQFHVCREFMRREPAKTVMEISEETGVPFTKITGWIRDGRMTI